METDPLLLFATNIFDPSLTRAIGLPPTVTVDTELLFDVSIMETVLLLPFATYTFVPIVARALFVPTVTFVTAFPFAVSMMETYVLFWCAT